MFEFFMFQRVGESTTAAFPPINSGKLFVERHMLFILEMGERSRVQLVRLRRQSSLYSSVTFLIKACVVTRKWHNHDWS